MLFFYWVVFTMSCMLSKNRPRMCAPMYKCMQAGVYPKVTDHGLFPVPNPVV